MQVSPRRRRRHLASGAASLQVSSPTAEPPTLAWQRLHGCDLSWKQPQTMQRAASASLRGRGAAPSAGRPGRARAALVVSGGARRGQIEPDAASLRSPRPSPPPPLPPPLVQVRASAAGQKEELKLVGPAPQRFAVAEGQLKNIASAAFPAAFRLGSGAFCSGYKSGCDSCLAACPTLHTHGRHLPSHVQRAWCPTMARSTPC